MRTQSTPRHFNPLPPHGGRPYLRKLLASLTDFNPLPPHGGRPYRRIQHCQQMNFNPLPPHGGRRIQQAGFSHHPAISIHSLRMEGDHVTVTVSSPSAQFQSTPSAWRETYDRDQLEDMDKFQSTPSAWRETDDYYFLLPKRVISIHSLRMEGDKSPVGGWETLIDISIHSLRMEGDNAR